VDYLLSISLSPLPYLIDLCESRHRFAFYYINTFSTSGDTDTAPDASGVGSSTVKVASERVGEEDSRVYHIYFTATDSKRAQSNGEVIISVPHDQAHKPVDQRALYDFTQCASFLTSTIKER
jgi:putative aminopeptidase FrvX